KTSEDTEQERAHEYERPHAGGAERREPGGKDYRDQRDGQAPQIGGIAPGRDAQFALDDGQKGHGKRSPTCIWGRSLMDRLDNAHLVFSAAFEFLSLAWDTGLREEAAASAAPPRRRCGCCREPYPRRRVGRDISA